MVDTWLQGVVDFFLDPKESDIRNVSNILLSIMPVPAAGRPPPPPEFGCFVLLYFKVGKSNTSRADRVLWNSGYMFL